MQASLPTKHMEERINHITELFLKDMKGILTPDEKKILDDWKAASPDNQALYIHFTSKENFLEALKFYSTEVVETVKGADQKFEQLLADRKLAEQKLHRQHQPEPGSRRWLYVAAAIVTGIGVFAWLLLTQFSRINKPHHTITKRQQQYDTTTASPGHFRNLDLPDGSHIQLNAGSAIYTPTTFPDKERRVHLKGEGYFKINPLSVKGKKMPFIVSIIINDTLAGEAEVLGTRFNIDAYGDDKQTCKLTVLEGKVKVSNKTGYKIVNPGYSASWSKEGPITMVAEAQPAADTLWMNHILSFSKTPVKLVYKQLGRVYNVPVEFRNGEIPGCLFTGELYTPSGIPKVLNIINDQCNSNASFDAVSNKIIVQ